MLNLGEDFRDCIAVIRSLVLIRKQLTTLRDIQGEYKAMEGENIPYARFGFQTLEEMLRHCGEFNLSRQLSGQVIISARLSANDEHMAKLVQETRSKKPTPRFNALQTRRFVRPTQPPSFFPRTGARSSPVHQTPRFFPNQFVQAARTWRSQSVNLVWRPLPPQAMERPPLVNTPRVDVVVPQPKPQPIHRPQKRPPQASSSPQTSTDLRELLNSRRPETMTQPAPGRPGFSVKGRLQVSSPEAAPATEGEGDDSGVHSAPSSSAARVSAEEGGGETVGPGARQQRPLGRA